MRDGVKIALDKFGKSVIQQSKTRLTKSKSNASKSLYDSLDYKLDVGQNSFSLSFFMNDYGKFIDKGVSGTEKKYNTPFRYKSKKPPAEVFITWSRVRNIKPRNPITGKFITNRSFGFIMQNHIFKKGIKPTEFFTKSFNQQFEKLPEDIVEAFSLQVDDLFNFSTNGI